MANRATLETVSVWHVSHIGNVGADKCISSLTPNINFDTLTEKPGTDERDKTTHIYSFHFEAAVMIR